MSKVNSMKKSFVLYLDQYEPIKDLSDAQKGQLLDAMFKYHNGLNFELSDPFVKMAFSFFKETFKRDSDKYLKRCEKNRENVRKRWNRNGTAVYDGIQPDTKHTDSDSDTIVIEDSDIKEKKPKKKKIPPSLKEVSDYCLERKNNINPQNFIDHYEANGWMRGKAKIKDWKACVRTWEQNNKNNPQQIIPKSDIIRYDDNGNRI